MLARRIAYERKQRNWSNAELAKRMTEAGCPLNQSAIQKIENGTPRRTISLDEALAFAEVFGRSLDEMQSVPEEKIGAELAGYLDDISKIEPIVNQLRGVILRVLERTARTAEDALPLIEYMGSQPSWPVIGELEDDLTRLADLIIKVRDSVGKLRFPHEAGQ